MDSEAPQGLLDDLLARLEADRAAILRGDLAALEGSALAQEELIEALQAGPPPKPEALVRLSAAARHNGALLTEAMTGLRDVAARVAVLERLRDGFDTYRADGAARRIRGGAQAQLHRRA